MEKMFANRTKPFFHSHLRKQKVDPLILRDGGMKMKMRIKTKLKITRVMLNKTLK